jgi:hypothetical protein
MEILNRKYLIRPISSYDSQLVIWNPGKLPDSLTVEQLKTKHRSIPRNRLIADVFFMAGYIEAWGRGIDIMLEGCRHYGIPEPVIVEAQEGISVTFQKDIYTEEYLRALDLNERQVKAVLYVKQHHSITNAEYQKLNNLGKSVSTTELQDLIDKKLVKKIGTTGRGTKYVLPDLKRADKGPIKGRNGRNNGITFNYRSIDNNSEIENIKSEYPLSDENIQAIRQWVDKAFNEKRIGRKLNQQENPLLVLTSMVEKWTADIILSIATKNI